MMSCNKENLITESKRKELGESPIFDVKDFVLRDQEILTFDSMQSTTSKDAESGTTYLSLMEQNLDALSKALQ